ncbi:MAG: hypothetical protein KGQ49_03090 [Verrucomicrobia bacterium]|nr:hypothetical protein [Verrucomicrobiota bacterium]MBU6446368.1 hypothetical protein [Verrucomicrobiota bacterium]MDE3047774.1 hypothetical protein [Verrucomicrobiota bacterium]
MKRRKILFASFGGSLLMHAMALFCFQKYSLWFSSSQTVQTSENWLSLVDKKERDQILKTAFDPRAEAPEVCVQPLHEEEALTLASKTRKEDFEPEHVNLFQLNLPLNEPLLAGAVLPTFAIPSQSFNLLDHLPKDLIVPISDKPKAPMFLPLPTKTHLELRAKAPHVEERPANLICFSDNLDFDLSNEPEKTRAPSPIPIPNLPKLPTLAELDTSSYSESFDADLVFVSKGEEGGYIFALTLIPRPDLNLPKLTQRVTFLIDRSNSIQQSRLSACKAAVHKALGELLPGDSFNIIAFDSKMDKMAPSFLPCTGKSYAVAEEFLQKVQLGSFFATCDLYKPLFLTVPGQVGQDEVHTAILLTDGEGLAKRVAAQAVLADWTSYNAGKVALFVMGMSDAYASKLEVATALNRGKVVLTPTNRGMKRKLLKLLKTIQNPVAKNISCHAISRSPTCKVVLYPKASQMPHLYLDQPFVILGEIDMLEDFILFVQGRLKDRWLNIKKTISFLNARKGSSALREELALQKANHLYEQYFLDEDPKHIAEARELLESFGLQVAF